MQNYGIFTQIYVLHKFKGKKQKSVRISKVTAESRHRVTRDAKLGDQSRNSHTDNQQVELQHFLQSRDSDNRHSFLKSRDISTRVVTLELRVVTLFLRSRDSDKQHSQAESRHQDLDS